MSDTLSRRLVGTWRHSHEEDTATETVYRPESYDFPPARGRVGFALKADHTGTWLALSPRDGTARQPCTWRVTGSARAPVLEITTEDGRREAWAVIEATAERLRLGAPR